MKQTEPAPHSAVLTHGMKVQTCWTHATVFSAVLTQLQNSPQDEAQPSPEHRVAHDVEGPLHGPTDVTRHDPRLRHDAVVMLRGSCSLMPPAPWVRSP